MLIFNNTAKLTYLGNIIKQNAEIMKKIFLQHGASRKIARAFNCSSTEVSYALNFTRDNDLSQRIRKVAIEEYGGHLIEFPA